MANSMLEVSKLLSKMPKLAAQFSQNALALAAVAGNSNTYMNLLKGQFAASIASAAAQNVYNSPSPSPPSIASSSSSPSTSSSSSILSRIQPNLLPPPPPQPPTQSSSHGLQALNLLNSLRQAAVAASINHPQPPPAPTSTIYSQPHLPHHVTPPPTSSELGQQQSPSKIYHCTQCQKLFFKFKHFKRHECEAATAKFTV